MSNGSHNKVVTGSSGRATFYGEDASGKTARIFVFGSNLSGIHGAGAAKYAKVHHQAEMGIGEGLTGTAYALPTVGKNISPMPLDEVLLHIQRFLEYAESHPSLEFQVTRVGCGLAGFTDIEIASAFVGAPTNCLFDDAWKPFLPQTARFWGSF